MKQPRSEDFFFGVAPGAGVGPGVTSAVGRRTAYWRMAFMHAAHRFQSESSSVTIARQLLTPSGRLARYGARVTGLNPFATATLSSVELTYVPSPSALQRSQTIEFLRCDSAVLRECFG